MPSILRANDGYVHRDNFLHAKKFKNQKYILTIMSFDCYDAKGRLQFNYVYLNMVCFIIRPYIFVLS